MLEDATDRRADAQMLLARLPAEIHTIEHERAQGHHCAADLVALRDVPRLRRRLDEIVDERVDAARPGRAEDRDLVRRQVVGREHAGTNRVVDVVVDVGNAIDDAEDLPFLGHGLVRAGVLEDAVAHLFCEIETAAVALERLDDAQRMLVVAEAAAAALAQELVERLLAGVSERRVPEVVPEPYRLDEVLVQAQGAGDAACDSRRLERVRQASAEVIAFRVDEDLRLVSKPPERLGVDDPVAVALERRSQPAFVFGVSAATGLVRADGERRQPALLVLSHEALEGIGNATGYFRHPTASVARRPDANHPPR